MGKREGAMARSRSRTPEAEQPDPLAGRARVNPGNQCNIDFAFRWPRADARRSCTSPERRRPAFVIGCGRCGAKKAFLAVPISVTFECRNCTEDVEVTAEAVDRPSGHRRLNVSAHMAFCMNDAIGWLAE